MQVYISRLYIHQEQMVNILYEKTSEKRRGENISYGHTCVTKLRSDTMFSSYSEILGPFLHFAF